MRKLASPGAALLALLIVTPEAQAQSDPRTAVSVVSGDAAFPFAVAAAEQFSLKANQAMPVVERLGSDKAYALLCTGEGPRFPDAAVAERPMTRAEAGDCRRQGIALSEAVLGHQAVALGRVSAAVPGGLTRRQIFLALARRVPVNGQVVDNPYRLWSDIDFSLPVAPIEVYGPPPGSPLRAAFVELVMAPAAAGFPELRGRAVELRADGVFTALGEDEAETLQRLVRRSGALGIFSFNFLAAQGARLGPLAVEGVAPSAAAIAEGRYPPSRALYLYAKPAQARHTPGLDGFLAEIQGPDAAGPGGYLAARGLVPLAAGSARLAPAAN